MLFIWSTIMFKLFEGSNINSSLFTLLYGCSFVELIFLVFLARGLTNSDNVQAPKALDKLRSPALYVVVDEFYKGRLKRVQAKPNSSC